MTEGTITTIVGSIVVMFTTLGTAWINRSATQKVDKKMDAQDEVLAVVKDNTDGNLTATKQVADAFAAEVKRVAQGGSPTPYGEPTLDRPVALSAGEPATLRPERPPPSDNEPRPPALPWEPASTTPPPMKNVKENTRKADP